MMSSMFISIGIAALTMLVYQDGAAQTVVDCPPITAVLGKPSISPVSISDKIRISQCKLLALAYCLIMSDFPRPCTPSIRGA